MAVASGVRPEQNGGDAAPFAPFFSLSLLISVSPYILYTRICHRRCYIYTYIHLYTCVRAIPAELDVTCALCLCACDNNNINPRGKKGERFPLAYIIHIRIMNIVAEYYEYYIIILKGFLFCLPYLPFSEYNIPNLQYKCASLL